MEPDWKNQNDPADTSLKEDLSIDDNFDLSYFSWDTSFNVHVHQVLRCIHGFRNKKKSQR